MMVQIMKSIQGDIDEIDPRVWAEGQQGLLNIPPIIIKMQENTSPIQVKQYPISLEGSKGLAPIIEQLLQEGILELCMLPHNTPILAVKKAEGKYRLMQHLREINKKTITRHPVVPNPYIILSQIPREHAWFTIIDLKDAFWACPLAEECQDWFAFEWEDPDTKRKQQLRWTHLPQGFTESPNLFGQALETLLEQFTPEGEIQILQYVDDLLVSGKERKCVKTTSIKLLNFLGEKGLKVSQEKLQFVESEATYLGHIIGEGYKKLSPERISVRAAAAEAIILHYMDDVLVYAPNDDLLSHALDLTVDSLVAAGFKLQEEKIQRMPPWKYLGLEIGEKSSDAMKHLTQAFSFLGIPKSIKTDNGPMYTSKEFRSFLQQWGVEHKPGIPYSLTGQAIVERTHQNLKRVLNQQHQSLKQETPQIQLSMALFTLNFLNCTFENLNPPTLRHFRENCLLQLKAKPPAMVKDPATRETEGPHDLITWGRGYACVSTPSGPKWVPAKWVKPFIPKTAKPPAEAPQVASAAWRRRKCRTFSF
ncbi:hypothetical protein DUI87_30751 [Hirundo rustica rustica]|uniref:ribonuclease H n=1 Tax=Hirundo rustica rustica TaxID=333673 RepID=A0A3M0IVM2_HIRRU|nr:hypothetical protein DUI87_30751 [Hirundo rustica rustica]